LFILTPIQNPSMQAEGKVTMYWMLKQIASCY